MRNTLRFAFTPLVTAALLAQAVADPYKPPRKGEHEDTKRDDDGFGEFNGKRWVINDCNASYEGEVDAASVKTAYAGLTGLGTSYPYEQAIKDAEEICHGAFHALGRLCSANRHRADIDPKISDNVKLVRCVIGSPKQGVKESFADGTWTISASLWTTEADLQKLGIKLATSLGLNAPEADSGVDTTPPNKRCTSNRDCASGSTCFASIAHGPRCFTAAELAPPPADDTDDDGGGDSTPTTSTTSTKTSKPPKKGEGESCTYSNECENRPGMRCSRPRGAPLKVHTTCMRSGY
jgi:hypothetical protein